jgi:hypothetical protein
MINMVASVSGKALRVSLATAACALLLTGSASAQTPAAPLQQALKTAATTAATETAAIAEQTPAAPADNPVLTFFKNTELSGFVDAYYTYNFNRPAKACATVGGVAVFNCLHNFDVAHNAFSLNLAEVALEKKPTKDSRGGFRVDLDYGPTAAMVAAFDPGGTAIYQNIQQAYASYLAPTSKGSLQIDFGKFVTHNGAEVIETKDNWNYSRGLLFSWAIPYYHSGVRATYSPTDKVSVMGEVTNGWNNVAENNTGKTVGAEVLYKPTSKAAITLNYTGGPEQTDDNADWRHLLDAVVSYTVSPKVSVLLNYDVAKDTVSGASVMWQGVAAYLKYTPNAWFAFVPRYEYFKDRDGFSTGTAQKLQEVTLTLEFKHKDGFLTRVEYRGDASDNAYFSKRTSEVVKNQNVFTVGWIYAFSSKTP